MIIYASRQPWEERRVMLFYCDDIPYELPIEELEARGGACYVQEATGHMVSLTVRMNHVHQQVNVQVHGRVSDWQVPLGALIGHPVVKVEDPTILNTVTSISLDAVSEAHAGQGRAHGDSKTWLVIVLAITALILGGVIAVLVNN
ncbi:MAG: hypothetical protein UV82_C0011G0049 [Candidatus Magasanikbacteria bacterium GW2011_GWD2_43_18]|uniref:Uncharacterized protein n=1 Tax=Candidatus Magasanikbacteria bacterium GW2011_GWE2_42_7 TaxID=1619052 RepID=A0A0G1BEA3_9BACT|nr:MAG: hypothetical protein UV18_C0007G0052 [Candidatus Magasanikbacteria bacterium GW2011_GWC2_42_27]KKS71529.1 MAG: hypothetical protein UV42_C0025G0008 [Candidatus Magasanikbacteria bacterium GW2011_GWE2_42_7]KKT04121.1 MAG: hypothetical protein UV82_C0011G0049 [Candidatus Magasanikbacteria bacterium GW2011_GWD2_43_18]KKT25700.1 MAG: hypothetical protein UW10_C0005G0067 [Candidatus Magasanikbacteria bacterium GW2011_GWA2_43_9]HCC13934.1 hypothetical protein [Candidatus Magasanikbacteria bac